jgi:4-hydroxythreonine-4-phosphate dehydrogenase
MTTRPVHIGITLGDPAGIGPEVVELAVRAFLQQAPQTRITLFGPAGVVEGTAQRLATSNVAMCAQQRYVGPLGRASAESGRASLDALEAAITWASSRRIDAFVTAPISKQALHMAGSHDKGHTEILARQLGNGGPVAMAFFTPQLKVVLATVHVPLKQAIASLTSERVVEVATLLDTSLRRDLGIPQPRLALAGLNPHAGEGGILGDEETTLLAPAVAECRARGMTISDPLPADTVFRRAVDGEFDGVVALYHDQGLIPVKLLAFGDAVNVTLGLRVPRTSPDHGTAYDRVGTGTARSSGMLEALRTAVQLAERALT